MEFNGKKLTEKQDEVILDGVVVNDIPNTLKNGILSVYTPLHTTWIDKETGKCRSGYHWHDKDGNPIIVENPGKEFWDEVNEKYPPVFTSCKELSELVNKFTKIISNLKENDNQRN